MGPCNLRKSGRTDKIESVCSWSPPFRRAPQAGGIKSQGDTTTTLRCRCVRHRTHKVEVADAAEAKILRPNYLSTPSLMPEPMLGAAFMPKLRARQGGKHDPTPTSSAPIT